MIGPLFCLLCGSTSCLHLQSRDNLLTMRQYSILRLRCDPASGDHEQIALTLRIKYGSLRKEVCHLYEKLHDFGIPVNSIDKLVLFALAHREALAIPLPTVAQYHPVGDAA
jgi:hypothetical protein